MSTKKQNPRNSEPVEHVEIDRVDIYVDGSALGKSKLNPETGVGWGAVIAGMVQGKQGYEPITSRPISGIAPDYMTNENEAVKHAACEALSDVERMYGEDIPVVLHASNRVFIDMFDRCNDSKYVGKPLKRLKHFLERMNIDIVQEPSPKNHRPGEVHSDYMHKAHIIAKTQAWSDRLVAQDYSFNVGLERFEDTEHDKAATRYLRKTGGWTRE